VEADRAQKPPGWRRAPGPTTARDGTVEIPELM
jgi:hypothetical protein